MSGHGDGGATLGGKIWSVLLLVIIAGVILYIWNSGLFGKGVQGVESLTPHQATSSSSTAATSTALPFGLGSLFGPGSRPSPQPPSGSSNSGYYYPSSTIGPTPTATGSGYYPAPYYGQPPAGYSASQISPYYRQVLLSSVYSGYGMTNGRILLGSNLQTNTAVDVTGWRIQGNRGSAYLPQAVAFYEPSGLAPEQDIELGPGQSIYVYSQPGSINLRLNECIGYLQTNLRTDPPLPIQCPYPDRSQLTNLSGSCQNYITSIPACTVPETYSPQISPNDYACQQYLSTMNYTGCFNAHVRDANFLSDQWWVWVGSNFLDPYHDVVTLYDKNNLIVDQYTY
ncbi:MAG TPA: hypothetical protein VMU07_03595 [Candidatus Paceibacterota bacterium]|nr:hypothetical protein [Candidatus Paceibacterota bacterium]